MFVEERNNIWNTPYLFNAKEFDEETGLHFELTIDGQVRQRGDTARMLFGIDRIIHHISQYITLKIGDLIYTGTPAGVGPVHPGDNLKASLEGHMLLDFDIR